MKKNNNLTYEQILFRNKISNLIRSNYTPKEIAEFTGWDLRTLRERIKEYKNRENENTLPVDKLP